MTPTPDASSIKICLKIYKLKRGLFLLIQEMGCATHALQKKDSQQKWIASSDTKTSLFI